MCGIRYHGFYSNAARGKRRRDQLAVHVENGPAEPAPLPSAAAARKRWAYLLRRVYEVDPLVCPRCASQMRVVGFITQPATIKRILDHLRRPHKTRPRPPPALRPQPSAPL